MSFIGVPNILPSWKSVLALHIQGSTSKDSNNCGFTQPWIQSFVDYVVMFSSVQSLSHVWLFETPWTAACQASLSITNSRNPPKLMSFESVMPSNNLILCRPLLLLHSIFPSIGVFSNESPFHSRWPKYCGPFQNLMDRQLENFSWNFIKKSIKFLSSSLSFFLGIWRLHIPRT